MTVFKNGNTELDRISKIELGFDVFSLKCIKDEGFVTLAFSENYKKVRKLTEGQNWKIGTTSKVMTGILLLTTIITPRGLTEQ